MNGSSHIKAAQLPQQLALVRRLFRDYAASLDISLAFQDFESEMANLPGDYAQPAGRLLLAWQDEDAVGCVALRRLEDGISEMKRLYVRPEARATGLGSQLAARICVEAREAGYHRIRLDTLATMTTARRLYAAMGFLEVQPYYFNPIPGAIFLELDLASPHSIR